MKTVLLVTGWASPKEIWSPVCSLLSDEYLLRVLTAHEILEIGPDIWKEFSNTRLTCVGWSMGGMLLIAAISSRLIDCESLVLVSSCSKMESSNGLLERTLRTMRAQLETDSTQVLNDFWKGVGVDGDKYVAYGKSQPTLSYGLKYLAESDISSKLQSINIPTTVIHGALDKIVPMELSSKLVNGVANAKFVSLKAGHDLPLSSPELIAEEIRAIVSNKDRLEFSNSAKSYDRWAEPQRVIGEHLLSISKGWLFDGSEVLDVGCGTGFMIAEIKKKNPRTKLTGLDSAPGMIEICKTRFRDYADINFLVGEAQSYLPAGPWNFIVSNSMLQWIENLYGCFSSWKEELSSDGKVIFSALVSGSFTEFEESYEKAVGRKSSSLSWKESLSYLEILKSVGFKTFAYEERTFKFSYKNAFEALSVFKRIGAISKREKPLTIAQTRKLIEYYENNFPADHGGVQVSYKALFVVAGVGVSKVYQ